ncbi:uncharacterized protein KY384_005857 [Bacidia gigantensis]|uniref:uncharacterized protein n=1 Tax=Bacidia gigantensis TaxID=2732470 RepID=UPI001D04795B|nr:uncharacterized protein KY384_005857 [Bacidia gigantensis]KAG8529222.1 hypothetical protein KY384_005857 [Bacidia gigantensis]
MSHTADDCEILFDSGTESTNIVPRYLFRAFSDQSSGRNSGNAIVPHAFSVPFSRRNPLGAIDHAMIHCPAAQAAIDELPLKDMKTMLEAHLSWDYGIPSEFSSWSSSFLFVLRHGIRKKYNCRESNICFCVFDTRGKSRQKIFPAMSLLRMYNIRDEAKMSHNLYDHEYLHYGSLVNIGNYSIATLVDLEDQDLYKELPELGAERASYDLSLRVEQLRQDMFGTLRITTIEEVRLLHYIAKCFDKKEFHIPIIVAILALRRRIGENDETLQQILLMIPEITLPEFTTSDVDGLRQLQSGAGRLLEVAEFARLLSDVYGERTKSVRPQVQTHPADGLRPPYRTALKPDGIAEAHSQYLKQNSE